MTKQTLELVASVINKRIGMAKLKNNAYYTTEECEVVIQEQTFTAKTFAAIFQEKNANFDKDRFYKACGLDGYE